MKLSFGILASCHLANAEYMPKKWHSKWIRKTAKNPMKAFGRSLTAGAGAEVEQNPCENATLTFVEENQIENGYWNCPEMTEARSEITCFGKCDAGFNEEWKRALVIVQCKNPPNTKSKVKGDLICSENSTEEEKCQNAEADFISQNPIENGHFECQNDAESGHRICNATCDDENAQSRWKSGMFYVVCGEKIKIKNKLKGELACLSSSSENLCQAAIDNGDINIPSGSLVFTHEKKGTLNYDVKCDDDQIMGSASCKDGKFWSKKLNDFPNSCNSSIVCREEQAYNVTDIGDGEWKCKNKQPNEMLCKGKCNQEKQKIRYGLRCTGNGWEFIDKQFLGDKCESDSTTSSPETTEAPAYECSAEAALELYPLGDGKWECKERKGGIICNGRCANKENKIRFNVGCWSDKGWQITKDQDFSSDTCGDRDPEITTTAGPTTTTTTTKDTETTTIITTSTSSTSPVACTEEMAHTLFHIGYGSWSCHTKGNDKFMCKGKCDYDHEEIRYKIACDAFQGWRISKNHQFSEDKCTEEYVTTTLEPTTTEYSTTSTTTTTTSPDTTTPTTTSYTTTTTNVQDPWTTTIEDLGTTTSDYSTTTSTTSTAADTTTTPFTTTEFTSTTSGPTTSSGTTTSGTTASTTTALASTESTTSAQVSTTTTTTASPSTPQVRRYRWGY